MEACPVISTSKSRKQITFISTKPRTISNSNLDDACNLHALCIRLREHAHIRKGAGALRQASILHQSFWNVHSERLKTSRLVNAGTASQVPPDLFSTSCSPAVLMGFRIASLATVLQIARGNIHYKRLDRPQLGPGNSQSPLLQVNPDSEPKSRVKLFG